MQIFYFSNAISIILCFILWGLFQVLAAYIAKKIPDRFLNTDNLIFRQKRFELNGRLYSKYLKINKWKHYLPDGAALFKKGYRKKTLTDFSSKNLEKFINESCRAELTHLLAIIPFWVFGFFLPPIGILMMFIYAILVNTPCILAQRYNRPRVIKLLMKIEGRNSYEI